MGRRAVKSGASVALVASDPFSTDPSRLEEHAETIGDALSSGSARWEVHPVFETSRDGVRSALAKIRPSFVEFSGHGSETGQVLLENPAGRATNLTGRTVSRLVEGIGPLRALVLNGCTVHRDRADLAEHAEVAIRVGREDEVATVLNFSEHFYSTLGAGGSVRDAFDRATGALAELGIPRRRGWWMGSHEDWERMQALRISRKAGVPRSTPAKEGGQPRAGGPGTAEHESDGTCLYRVWYGTNRAPKDPTDLSLGFAARVEPGQESVLHVGRCVVVIPPSHKTGSIGSARWKVWKKDRLRVLQRLPLDWDRFHIELSQALEEVEDRRGILCYVHGYNVTFDEAVRRAAQLGFDLNFQGETAVFSWPSAGRLAGYLADSASVDASEPALAQFLSGLAERSGARDIHLIAHSMGNRALLRAIDKIASAPGPITFSQILLAAPDVDVGLFKRLSRVFPSRSRRTTLYTCPRDQALKASGFHLLHGYPRAGFSPPVTCVAGIDTIEVRTSGLGLLGHSYYGDNWPVLADMNALIEWDSAPSKRVGLREHRDTTTHAPFWVMD